MRASGEIKWGGRSVFISETLAGEPVGIAETREGDWLVRYAEIDLGIIDPRTNRLIRFVPAPIGPAQSKPTTKTVTYVSGLICNLCSRLLRLVPINTEPPQGG